MSESDSDIRIVQFGDDPVEVHWITDEEIATLLGGQAAHEEAQKGEVKP